MVRSMLRCVPLLLTGVLLACTVACTVACTRVTDEDDGRPPNLIFIMADDLGYGDLGAYGQTTIRTPRLDSMAATGTRFTHFYAGSTVCAPSRYTLMTGRHTGHALVRGNANDGAGIPLPAGDTTLAEILHAAGYTTGMFGKWGLGVEGTSGAPHRQGFDRFFGYLDQIHAHSYHVDHLWEARDDTLQRVPVDTAAYAHDLIVEAAFDFVRANRDRPFFLYLPVTPPHAELIAPEAAMQAYRDSTGHSRFEPETPFEGSATYRPQPTPNAALAAMITYLDRDVGRLLDLLDELGLSRDTIVFFTSDNGPHAAGGRDPDYFDSNGPLRGIKRDLYEGGIRVPMIVWGPGRIPAGRVDAHPWALWDIPTTLSELTGRPAPPSGDGLSMVNLLLGEGVIPIHDYLYWEFYHPGRNLFTQAVRENGWKLLRFTEPGRPPRIELYDLNEDAGEEENLATTYPAVANRLNEQLDALRTPPSNPAFQLPAQPTNTESAPASGTSYPSSP